MAGPGARPHFRTRREAGERLAGVLADKGIAPQALLGIPRGGVAVARPVADRLGLPLDVAVVRKIPIPWEPEAGYGAVAPDGSSVLNEGLVRQLRLSPSLIAEGVEGVLKEVRRREAVYRAGMPPLTVAGATSVLVDDGLASGHTALAAVGWLRKAGASQVIIASPVASSRAMEILEPAADQVLTLYVSHARIFAVASFYDEFPDLADAAVIALLRRPPTPSRT